MHFYRSQALYCRLIFIPRRKARRKNAKSTPDISNRYAPLKNEAGHSLHTSVFLWRAIHIFFKLRGEVAHAVKSRTRGDIGNRIKLGLQKAARDLDPSLFDIFYG